MLVVGFILCLGASMGIAFDDDAADALIRAANSACGVLRAEGGSSARPWSRRCRTSRAATGASSRTPAASDPVIAASWHPYCGDTHGSLVANSHSIRNCWKWLSKPRVSGHVRGFVHSQEPDRALPCDNTVPEVGLERDSRPWKRWEVAETCGIRASPTPIRSSSRWKVWTSSTLPFLSLNQGHAGRPRLRPR
ncbi:hypothetical protein ABIE37_000467 [Arthrobacter bambusae]|uniref:Uncharacterized protein n=1 Tax=Arthrobacter bambusae TaxID=1338426 RepID=A0ABV2P1Z7_9MICC